ncbi:hypothetical protein, partial [Stenotrophomonas sp. YIM B06876]|uniref:hypothetical protein n=1 Tax=Stenotrophomonas sp. YIM B06876 TaxID=3060211 RepID=UPI002738C60B
MNFNHMPVARKLWAIILGLMLAMLALAFGLLYNMAQVNAEVERNVQYNEDRIILALRWKGLSQLSVERAIVSAISSDDYLADQMAQLMKEGIEGITELQNKVTAVAFSSEDKQQLERLAAERALV